MLNAKGVQHPNTEYCGVITSERIHYHIKYCNLTAASDRIETCSVPFFHLNEVRALV